MFKRFLMAGLAMCAMSVSAADAAMDKVKFSMGSKLGLEVLSVADSPVDGLLEVYTDRGLFYVTPDGNHMIYGKMFGLEEGVTNLSEESYAEVRKQGMAKYEESMIVYPAKNEKYEITVFTDLTCGYCRRLHSQMAGYNELGITVRYLAYPRQGIGSQSYNDIKSVFCAKDPNKAMDDAKNDGKVVNATCTMPVDGHYKFGQSVGVSGTPAIMLEDGFMIPGYKSPADLIQAIGG